MLSTSDIIVAFQHPSSTMIALIMFNSTLWVNHTSQQSILILLYPDVRNHLICRTVFVIYYLFPDSACL